MTFKKTVNILKTVAYLLSIVLPVIDAIRGIKSGIKLGLMDKEEADALRHYWSVKTRMSEIKNDDIEER